MSTPPPTYPSVKLERRIDYVDRLKVLMIVLVILHHTFITYGAPGGWYYAQKTTQQAALIPMTLFVAVNQSFFMGFFFFLSALFVPASYEKKGARRFVTDRLIRLGIPLVFYSFLFGPVMNYLVYYVGYNHHISFMQYLSGYDDWIDFGVLWFVAALLLFNLVYVFWRVIFKPRLDDDLSSKLPVGKILVFTIGLGIVSFLVRIIFPIGWVLKPVGFQLGHFPQYIVMFILGLMANRNTWIHSITSKDAKQLARIAGCAIALIFPLFYVLLTWLKFPSSYFSGGVHWPSLLYALWEQVTGLCIMAALLYFAREHWYHSSKFSKNLSRSAFAVYIFHPIVVISIALALKNWDTDPVWKLLVAAPFAIIGSFLLGSVIVSIPGVKKIV
ncbi:MAG: acyltransferase [Bacteroidetes bacterium]|jgi:uncharacterized integral membrane protein|nr:acyltransferase [Bacteroidota bacterium]